MTDRQKFKTVAASPETRPAHFKCGGALHYYDDGHTEPCNCDYQGAFRLLYSDIEDAVLLGSINPSELRRLLTHRLAQFGALMDQAMKKSVRQPAQRPAPPLG